MRCSIGTTSTLAVAMAACLLCATRAEAKKPKNPPGGGGGPDNNSATGVIYFRYEDQVWTMSSDGSAKTPLANTAIVRGSPSQDLHSSQRWFLEMNDMFPLEYYPDFEQQADGSPVLDSQGNPVVKQGAQRKEVFAAGQGGQIVQLTTQPDLEILAAPVWGIDDETVSWVARRWDDNPASSTFGSVLEGGLYVGQLEYDNSGSIIGLQQQPGEPLVSVPLFPSNIMRNSEQQSLAPDIQDHSWSPNGTEFVFDALSAPELWIGDLLASSEETLRLLLDDPDAKNLIRARWSPAGDKILFEEADGRGALHTVNVDGTDVNTIATGTARRPVYLPHWSPSGTHVLYHEGDNRTFDVNIIRATADGGSRTKLTRDISGDGSSKIAIGWRSGLEETDSAVGVLVAGVPEPSAVSLAAIGIFGLLGCCRRRRPERR